MIRYLAYGVGGSIWFVLVFFVSWRMTFPSDEASEYVAHQLSVATNGAYKFEMSSIVPWGIGVASRDLAIYATNPKQPDEGDTLLMSFESFRAHSSIGTLLAQSPRVKGDAQISDSVVKFDVDSVVEDGLFKLQSIELDAGAVPFATFTGLLSGSMGLKMTTTGGLDSKVKLDLSEGFREADGLVKFASNDLVITSLEVPMMGPLGQQVIVDDLDIKLDIDKGKAKVEKGVISSDAVSVDIEGEISLRDPVDRSGLRLDAVLELGEGFSMVEGFIRSAKWDDDKYHYTISGTLGNPSFRPARQPSSRSATASSTRTRATTTAPEPGFDPRSLSGDSEPLPSAKTRDVSDELDDRRARRDEMRRRLSLGRPTSTASRADFDGDEEFDGEEGFEEGDEEFEEDEEELELEEGLE